MTYYPGGLIYDRGGPFVCDSTFCTIRPPQPPSAVFFEPAPIFPAGAAAIVPFYPPPPAAAMVVAPEWRLIGYCVAQQCLAPETQCLETCCPDLVVQPVHDHHHQCRPCHQGRRRRGRRDGGGGGRDWTPRSSFFDGDVTENCCDHHHHEHDHAHVQLIVQPQQQLVACRTRRYRLYVRRGNCSFGWQYAVTEEGVGNAIFIVLAPDPRVCQDARDGFRCRRVLREELQSGDTIFIPGEQTLFIVHVYTDDWHY